MKNLIQKGMALAFFATAYAEEAEDKGHTLRGEIMDQLPERTDPSALKAAYSLYAEFEKNLKDAYGTGFPLNGVWVNDEGIRKMTGDTVAEKAEAFGHYAAMQAMGEGVGLWEYCSEQLTEHVPYIEFGHFCLECEYFEDEDSDDA